MANIKEWLEQAEIIYGETIEAVVAGKHYGFSFDEAPAQQDENIVLSRRDGLAKLDQEFDSGYGGADCFPVYAWTKTHVFFVHEYDGATGLNSVPRNPMPVNPDFGGNDIGMEQRLREIAARVATAQ